MERYTFDQHSDLITAFNERKTAVFASFFISLAKSDIHGTIATNRVPMTASQMISPTEAILDRILTP